MTTIFVGAAMGQTLHHGKKKRSAHMASVKLDNARACQSLASALEASFSMGLLKLCIEQYKTIGENLAASCSSAFVLPLLTLF